ncbi:D,D-heptose 1,7-bisphosphate phosphatase [Clostridia bacterium]|nr:D,D-heptose 1,7-bisphosphate phosphatase [Clostridia bacterium]
MNRAVFLDRDGTIIKDCHYLKDPAQVELLPGVAEALRELKRRGFLLILVSNQSGIARGYFTERDLQAVQDRLNAVLSEHGAALDGAYNCPHAPDDDCGCRKPKIGMALAAKRDFDLDLSESYMVGDKQSDIEFGRNFGAKAAFYSISELMKYF